MRFFTASTVFVLLACHVQDTEAVFRGTAKDQTEFSSPVERRKLQTQAGMSALPTQTFFVPLPEESLFQDLFYKISQKNVSSPVETMLSVTISTDKTIIWWDHWEDGYDQDVVKATAPTTEIWGDGNAANGCAPSIKNCTNSLDLLKAGDSIVIQNAVAVPRVKAKIFYDGGDRIQSSFPVAVTRAAFPRNPGSVLAGAVEVLDTTQWGKTFESPVGSTLNAAFELTLFFFQAVEDNTKVTLPTNATVVLQKGQSSLTIMAQAGRISSDKPIQVNLITGDVGSAYETRWYSMRPIEAYSNSYVTPVGDSIGKTKVIIYNPASTTLTYTMQYLINGILTKSTATVATKQTGFSPIIPSGSGAWIDGNSKFVALTWTDSELIDGANFQTDGQMYDWGCPVVPRNELTPQVLIGLGFACTNNDCKGLADRSIIWISPVADADIYVDFNNTGSNQKMFTVNALASIKVADLVDHDMSGAMIFAVKKGGPKDGTPVDIAVAWGQDPTVSKDVQAISMDMGTVVLPFTSVKVAKLVDKNIVTPGEELLYTIRVSNVGQKNVAANMLTVKDTLDADVTYIAGSTQLSSVVAGGPSTKVADSVTGTPFPLDDTGFIIAVDLPRRGGTVDVTFKVKVASAINTKAKVINKGALSQTGGSDLPFEVTSVVDFGGAVAVENSVMLGLDGSKCATLSKEYVEDYIGSSVTYCFKVVNTGKAHLSKIELTNAELGYTQTVNGTLAPGASKTIFTNQKLTGPLTNNVVVVAKPVFPSGLDIPDANNVTATDPSQVGKLLFKPSVFIDNKVYPGSTDNGAKCGSPAAVEKVTDIYGSPVTYCFTVTNTGNTYLNTVLITNKFFNFTRGVPGILAPGQNTTISLPGTIIADLENTAVVTAIPVLIDGTKIVEFDPVTNSDPSAVAKLSFKPNILIENTVYLGKDGGKMCGTSAAVEYVADYFGADATYCFKVINNGDTYLNKIELADSDLSFSDKSIGTLAPGASAILSLDRKISTSLKNTATVTGKPIMADGRAILDASDPTFSDPSAVGVKQNAPSIDIDNTVLLGSGTCGTALAKDYVEDYPGSKVTYCFTVKNTGDTHLDSIVITDGELTVKDTSIGRLAPGVSAVVAVERTIAGKLENMATVTANPTLKDGSDIPNQADVTDSDTSAVGELAYKPAVKVANTVYLGDKEARACASAVEYVEAYFGAPVTYCFNVTNVGNTMLDTFKIVDDALSFQDQISIKKLAPGESGLISIPGKIASPLENTCKVTASPCKGDGSKLPLPDVTYSDPSSVGRIANKPSIKMENTVYLGVVDDKLCGTDKAVSIVKDIFMSDVAYCLKVTNTGDTHLDSVTIVDKELEFTQTLPAPLAPGESKLVPVPGKILSDLKNTAVVTANPILKDGTDITGIPDVTHSATSEVKKLSFVAQIKVDNTVYLGDDGGKSCLSSTESVKNFFGSNVTYCFKVTNNGETHLSSVSLTDEGLVYYKALEKPLAPGLSVTLTFPSTITASKSNTVLVYGKPTMADGRLIGDLNDVNASDPSGVEMLDRTPSVKMENTVYLGSDSGAKCNTPAAVELVQGRYGSAVTYCLKVTNTGDAYLGNVVVVDDELALANTSLAMLAPGESITIPVPQKITGDLTNRATVSGRPCLKDGTNIPKLDVVKATDPSAVSRVIDKPSINIENTVYIGSDGGAACVTSKLESVKGYANTGVVYCFEVTNTGDSYLSNVVIADSDLSFKDGSIVLLAPGASKIVSLPGFIGGSKNNTATVTATPSQQDGTKLPGVADVSDSDPSGVVQQIYLPKVSIDNTVALGHGGDLCKAGSTRDLVEGIYGTAVTYCFTVTNLGDTTLKDIKIVDELLAFTNNTLGPLAPGKSVTVPFMSTIVADLKNMAVVTATPVTSKLETIPGLNIVTSQDPSAVDKFDYVGGIKIDNTVFVNGKDGATCSSAFESVDGTYGTGVTYCFTVTNTGDTVLADIVVRDAQLNFTSGPIKNLPPGASITLTFPAKIVVDLENVAVVTANPITADGKDIPDLNDVRGEDPSAVKKVDIDAEVSISNKVYLGNDGGKKCGSADAVELVEAFYGANVTYCFEVTNSGDSSLSSAAISDKELNYNSTIGMLAPGATKMLSTSGKITGPLKNMATVTGIPCLGDGTIIPGKKPVTASDPSAVERVMHIPTVNIDNTVYLGGSTVNNGNSLCGTKAAVDYVEHYLGAVVTYCFAVTNKGDSHLNKVVIVDKELSFTDDSIKSLAPGESAIIAFTTKIGGPLKNNAVVSANPILPDGTDIPDVPDVTWSDSSAVGELKYAPSVTIDNRVYLGDDNGKACAAAVESVISNKGDKVVYCFNVTNKGDTYLNNVNLVDTEISYMDNSIGLMAPGASVLLVFKGAVNGNITNHAIVTANPVLADGADISGALDVTATDSSEVLEKTPINSDTKSGDKDPYAPPDGPQKCIQDNWKKAGHKDDLVCASKEVFLDSLTASKPLTCTPGTMVNITVDASIHFAGPKYDVGWYVANDGGDALVGTCIVNGLQDKAAYPIMDLKNDTVTAGYVKWHTKDGADGDQCGDVFILNDGSAKTRTPLLVKAQLPCIDDNDDGKLDFALCFTWKTDKNNLGTCSISSNIPGSNCGCFCTRYDVPNIDVDPPPNDVITPC